MQDLQRRRARRSLERILRLLTLFVAPVFWVASAKSAAAQIPSEAPWRDRVLLGELYAQVRRINPRAAAARSLTVAAEARVAGATRPPDPQFQLGFMNYTVPGLARRKVAARGPACGCTGFRDGGARRRRHVGRAHADRDGVL
jgi:hypothetical protein